MTSRFKNILLTVTLLVGLGALAVPATKALAEQDPNSESESSTSSTNTALSPIMGLQDFVAPTLQHVVQHVFIADRYKVEERNEGTPLVLGADPRLANKDLFDLMVPKSDKMFVGTKGHDYITATKAHAGLTIIAGKGNDVVLGSSHNDVLKGGQGNDSLVGSKGDDVLNGGTGRNVLVGGAGNDTFVVKGHDQLPFLNVGDIIKNHAELQYEATRVGYNWDYSSKTGVVQKKWMPVHTEKSIAAMMPTASAVETGVEALLKKIRAHRESGGIFKICKKAGYTYEDTPLEGDHGLFASVHCLAREAMRMAQAPNPLQHLSLAAVPFHVAAKEWDSDFNELYKTRAILRTTDMKTKVSLLLYGFSAVIVDDAGVVKHLFFAESDSGDDEAAAPQMFKKK